MYDVFIENSFYCHEALPHSSNIYYYTTYYYIISHIYLLYILLPLISFHLLYHHREVLAMRCGTILAT